MDPLTEAMGYFRIGDKPSPDPGEYHVSLKKLVGKFDSLSIAIGSLDGEIPEEEWEKLQEGLDIIYSVLEKWQNEKEKLS